MNTNKFTLLELNREIKDSIEKKFDKPIWLVAEINRINIHSSGHCYLELVQKSNVGDNIIASARGVIWSSIFSQLKKFFESTTGAIFSEGINVLVKVSVDFHELYGLSINIRDIDPAYTLGDIAKRRKEIIDKLSSENIIDMNKSIDLPIPIQKIAIISSSTAAGYEDFTNQLFNNKYNYKYHINLFEANMQGINTENSIINAFNKIFEIIENFDIVVIIRGGGSKTDLAAFDNFNIAFHITQFPIPVISGIGHERDDTVADIVAHTKLKTPTAVANFIIDNTYKFENNLFRLYENIIDSAKDKIYIHNLFLTQTSIKISKLRNYITKKIQNCNEYFFRLKQAVNKNFQKKILKVEDVENNIHMYYKSNLQTKQINLYRISDILKSSIKINVTNKIRVINNIDSNIRLIDPKNILRRGFSITKQNGKILKEPDNIKIDDEIETIFYKSGILSKVVKKFSADK